MCDSANMLAERVRRHKDAGNGHHVYTVRRLGSPKVAVSEADTPKAVSTPA